ncbi:hypothetical protein MTO96_006884 [Rhipicephalus appendiculatus]
MEIARNLDGCGPGQERTTRAPPSSACPRDNESRALFPFKRVARRRHGRSSGAAAICSRELSRWRFALSFRDAPSRKSLGTALCRNARLDITGAAPLLLRRASPATTAVPEVRRAGSNFCPAAYAPTGVVKGSEEEGTVGGQKTGRRLASVLPPSFHH